MIFRCFPMILLLFSSCATTSPAAAAAVGVVMPADHVNSIVYSCTYSREPVALSMAFVGNHRKLMGKSWEIIRQFTFFDISYLIVGLNGLINTLELLLTFFG